MSFYLPRGDGFEATELTRGPWSRDHQHGGPPAALLAGAIARTEPDAGDFTVVRLWFELLAPIPLGPVKLRTRVVHEGRSVQRLEGELLVQGRPVMTAQGLRIRRADLEVGDEKSATWPPPDAGAPFVLPFFRDDVAYHRAIELRLVHGTWGSTPVGFWVRPVVPLVEGRLTSPLERLTLIADAQSGMGLPLDPARFSFVNPDLSIFLERPPRGEWFGFDIRSTAGAHGSGLSQSGVHDEHGLVARSAQTLVIWPQ